MSYTNLFIPLLVGLFCGSTHLMSQSTVVNLDEVQIMGSRKSSYSSDLHMVRIDSLLKTKYAGSDLSQILMHETNLNITQYGGQGSLASLRLRGSAPSQTQINWNGIPVNSPTTGSIDLSLLCGGMADAIEIAYGAGGSLFGNGTFGGSVNLFNKPDWDNRLTVSLAGEAGSWNHIKSGVTVRAGGESFQYHLSGLYQSSPNAYRYENVFKSGNPVEYRLNDSMNLMAIQQHFFFRLPHDWFIQYGFWWHSRDKQLPAPMSSTPSFTAFQKDRNLRQFIRATKWYKKSSVEMVAAFFTDSLLYGEKNINRDSVMRLSGIRSTDSYVSLYHRWFLSDHLTIESGADFEYQTALTGSYTGLAAESRGALFSLLKLARKQLSANVSYRQVFYSMTGPKPLFAAAVQYHPSGSEISLKGQVSNKFRFPTLNDRFWQPGGNRELMPETGVGYDAGMVWHRGHSAETGLNLSTLLFIQNINNWIQWVPAGTFWSPRNVRQVRCQGLETDLTGRWNAGAATLTAKVLYTYTESLDMSLPASESRYSRQLAYVPFHLVKVQYGINYHRFEVTAGYKYTGRRFTTDDHDPWLDLEPYHLADLSVGYTFLTRRDRIVVSGNLYNLFNSSYQMIRAYPAPGRSFYLSVNYLFNQKKQGNAEN